MINPEWNKWIVASVNKYFKDAAAVINSGIANLFVKGDSFSTEGKTHWIEVRINGPRFTEQTKGDYDVQIDLNIMCSVPEGSNLYNVETIAGKIQSLINSIAINKSDGVTFVGCLDLVGQVDVIDWGVMNKISQTSVDAQMKMSLTGA